MLTSFAVKKNFCWVNDGVLSLTFSSSTITVVFLKGKRVWNNWCYFPWFRDSRSSGCFPITWGGTALIISPPGVLPFMSCTDMCRGIGYGFWGSRSLKEQCHEDFAVLGQYILRENHYFEALVINKMLLQSYDEDIKWILSERANQNKFLEADFWNT